MSLKDEQTLFSDNPIRDLTCLVQSAKKQNATRLLLLAGKHPVCRIQKTLSPPMVHERLHFSQTETLANALLNDQQKAELDQRGAIEITVKLAGETYPCSIFYGNGSHNFIVFLAEED